MPCRAHAPQRQFRIETAGQDERKGPAQHRNGKLDHSERDEAVPRLKGDYHGGGTKQVDRDLQGTIDVEAMETGDDASEDPPHEGAGDGATTQEDNDPGFVEEVRRDMEEIVERQRQQAG